MPKLSFSNIYDVAGLPNLLNNVSNPSPPSSTQKLTFYLPSDLARRLDLVVRASAISRSSFIAQLVKKELDSPASLLLQSKMDSLFDENSSS